MWQDIGLEMPGQGAGGDPVEPFASSAKVSGLYLEGSGELGSVWEC